MAPVRAPRSPMSPGARRRADPLNADAAETSTPMAARRAGGRGTRQVRALARRAGSHPAVRPPRPGPPGRPEISLERRTPCQLLSGAAPACSSRIPGTAPDPAAVTGGSPWPGPRAARPPGWTEAPAPGHHGRGTD
ncbi:hypothetical protein QJS66_07925 [Kocuria rhizophila]|nr:hypothetical protein QJS66_07925 [Kocuria rhizophila]